MLSAKEGVSIINHKEGVAINHDNSYTTFWEWCYEVQTSRKREIQEVLTMREEQACALYSSPMDCWGGLKIVTHILRGTSPHIF